MVLAVLAFIAFAGFASDVVAQSTKLRALNTQNDALAWEAVGRLDVEGKGYCTATLIAPDLVLTAAHCVYFENKLIAPSDLVFLAGLTNGTLSAKRDVAQVIAHPNYDVTMPFSGKKIRYDLALIRLAAPISSHEIAPFAVHETPLIKGPVSVVSYGRGRSNKLSRQNQCQVVECQNDLYAFDCSVTFGSSGAPVFTHQNGRGRIVSVISAMGPFRGQQSAFGMALPQSVALLKSKMVANAPRPKAQVRRLGLGGNRDGIGAKFVRPKGP